MLLKENMKYCELWEGERGGGREGEGEREGGREGEKVYAHRIKTYGKRDY